MKAAHHVQMSCIEWYNIYISMTIPVLYSQRDSRWANKFLGTSTVSMIGVYGCVLTSLCMLVDYYGKNTTPDIFNTALSTVGFFYQGTLATWYPVNKVYPDIICDSVVLCGDVPAPMADIDAYLSLGKPVIVEVDFDHDTSDGIQTHFVLIYDKADGKYAIADPWYGDTSTIQDRYCTNSGLYPSKPSDTILQVVYYTGPVPQQQDQQAIIDQLRTERDTDWNLYQGEVQKNADLQHENAGLKAQVDSYDTFIATLAMRLNVAKGQSDILGAIGTLISEEDTLHKTVQERDTLKQELSDTESALSKSQTDYSQANTDKIGFQRQVTTLTSQLSDANTMIASLKQATDFRIIFPLLGKFVLAEKVG